MNILAALLQDLLVVTKITALKYMLGVHNFFPELSKPIYTQIWRVFSRSASPLITGILFRN